MRKNERVMPQWKKRVACVKFIYSELINNNSASNAKEIIIRDYLSIDANFMELLEYFVNNREKLIKEIEVFLSDNWKFERLNYVEQAILLLAWIEATQKKIDKAIIIDQAIITAKSYCDKDSYKFINAVLNRMIK